VKPICERKILIVAWALAGMMAAIAADASETRQLRVRAYIDGISQLVISDRTVVWHHIKWAAPGVWAGADEATRLEGDGWTADWKPLWPQPGENRDCDCDSATAYLLPPADALAREDQTVGFQVVEGRERVVLDHPSAANHYTFTLTLDDDLSSGADWYDVVLTYQAAPTYFFGGDSNVDNTRSPAVPAGTQTPGIYDIYLPQIGRDTTPCIIADNDRNDVFGVAEGNFFGYPECRPNAQGRIPGPGICSHVCPAAKAAADDTASSVYGYWFLKGPDTNDIGDRSAYDYGVAQAAAFLRSYLVYSARTNPSTGRPVLSGRTLFGDVENLGNVDPGHPTAGWHRCQSGEACLVGSPDCRFASNSQGSDSTALCLQANRDTLAGFIDTLAQTPDDVEPGIYTNATRWAEFFGRSHRPARPFALWLTSCHLPDGPASPDPATHIATYEQSATFAALGGMTPVVLQFSMRPDFDLAAQDPAVGFHPVASSSPTPFAVCP
jgi:hypothetical protein